VIQHEAREGLGLTDPASLLLRGIRSSNKGEISLLVLFKLAQDRRWVEDRRGVQPAHKIDAGGGLRYPPLHDEPLYTSASDALAVPMNLC